MASLLRSILPNSSSKSEDYDEDYSVEYSIALEYSGPPVSHEIPQLAPVDVRRIPTAAVAAKAVMLSNLSIPIVQPIVKKSDKFNKRLSGEMKSGIEVVSSQVQGSHLGKFGGIYSRKVVNCGETEDALETADKGGSVSNVADESSSGSLGFSDGRDDSNQLSGSSDVEDLDDDNKANVSYGDLSDATTSNSIEQEEECVAEVSGQGNRTSVVKFAVADVASSESASEESDHEDPAVLPQRPVVLDDVKGLCHRCQKQNRFAEREVCIVCNAKYCSKCVLRAMGSMPEGRKCITCTGFMIDESKRRSLGKCSRMLERLLTDCQIEQIMSAEMSCEFNQLPPSLIFVNDHCLSKEELLMLQNCRKPPKKLRPGRYWYDRVSGFWGKEGEKPCQIISPLLQVGYQMRKDASNGNTNVLINGREITKAELWMLRVARIHCEGNPHFWINADGSYQHEGMNNVLGKLWEKKLVKMTCVALSLPFPSDTANSGCEEVDNDSNKVNKRNLEKGMMNKLLLVGCDQSGTSTIFKQAKILYNVPFMEDEKQDIKIMIQRNLYRYICILLGGRERFKEDHVIEIRRQRADEPGPSGKRYSSFIGWCVQNADPSLLWPNITSSEILKKQSDAEMYRNLYSPETWCSDEVDETNAFLLSPRLEAFSSWLLQIMASGDLEAIFPAATREYSPLVEDLWKDKAFQAIYKRRNELPMLPRVANYFLDRAVEISRGDYEPSEMDILYSDGITTSNGVASMEFCLSNSSPDGYMESLDQNEPPVSYQLIRVHASSLGENCKWLEMFEDVDLVLYCVSLTDYAESHEDIDGTLTNKMLETKKLFEKIVTHPTFAEKGFLLLLNKFDLLEEMIEQVPLSHCEWFHDFKPLMSVHPHNPNSNNNPSLAHRAFHYVGVKFKRLFTSLTGRNLFVTRTTGLEADSVDKALRYGKEILKWDDERHTFSMNEWSSESNEPSTSAWTS